MRHFATHGKFVIGQKIQLCQFHVERGKLCVRPFVFAPSLPKLVEASCAKWRREPDAKSRVARCELNQSAAAIVSHHPAPFRFGHFAIPRWRAIAILECILSMPPDAEAKLLPDFRCHNSAEIANKATGLPARSSSIAESYLLKASKTSCAGVCGWVAAGNTFVIAANMR